METRFENDSTWDRALLAAARPDEAPLPTCSPPKEILREVPECDLSAARVEGVVPFDDEVEPALAADSLPLPCLSCLPLIRWSLLPELWPLGCAL